MKLNNVWKFDVVNSAWCWLELAERHMGPMLLFPCILYVQNEWKGESGFVMEDLVESWG